MSCDTGLPETDPARLRPILLRRMPNAAGAADEFLREAATEFFRKSGAWRDQRMTLICDTARTSYELPTPLAGKIVRLAHVWLTTSSGECKIEHDAEIRSSIAGVQKWHQPSPKTIGFHRPFESDTTLRFETVLTIGDDNVGAAALIDEYREGIIAGASYYATMSQDKKTSNRNAGIDYHSLFTEAIRDAACRYQQTSGTERAPMSRMKVVHESRS